MSVSASDQRPLWKMISRELPSRFSTGKNRRLAAIVEGIIQAGIDIECHFLTGSLRIPEPRDEELWSSMAGVILWKIDSEEIEEDSEMEMVAGVTVRHGSSIRDALEGEFESASLEGVIFTSIESVSSLWDHIPSRVLRVLECDELESYRMEEFSRIEESVITSFEKRSFVAKGILERQWLAKFDLVALSSEREIEKAVPIVASEDKLAVWPNIAAPPFEGLKRQPPEELTLFFVGLLGYPPNQDALLWFLEVIFPLIREKRPDAVLRVVGHRCPDSLALRLNTPGVDFLGYQPGLELFYATSTAAVIPLRAGTGTRIKILEAFSHSCPVVSTTKGAEGLSVEGGRELLLADDPELFAASCLSLHEDSTIGENLAKEGLRFWNNGYTQQCLNRVMNKSIVTLRKAGEFLDERGSSQI